MNELIHFKDYIIEELETIDRHTEAEYIVRGISSLHAKLNGKFVLASGDVVTYQGVDKFNSPQLATLKEQVKTGLDKYRAYTLKEDDKKLIVIKDIVFRSNKALYRLASMGYFLGIALGIIGIGSIVASFFFIKKAFPAFVAFMAFGGITILFGCVMMFLQYRLKKNLSKKHY